MIKKISRRILVTVFALVILLCGSVPMQSQARTEIRGFAKAKLTVYTNMTETLRVYNPMGNVKWKSSNPKIASVLGTRGSEHEIATIITGKRTGRKIC